MNISCLYPTLLLDAIKLHFFVFTVWSEGPRVAQITCCGFKVQHWCLHYYHAFEISVDYERWQIAVVTQHFQGAAVKGDCIYFPLFYFPFYLPCFSLPPLPSLAHVINSWSKTEVSEFHPTVPDQRDEYELLKGLSPFNPISAIQFSWQLWGWGSVLLRNRPWNHSNAVSAHK